MPILEYSGAIYVRPIGRGICLMDAPNEPQIEDFLNEGDYYAEIKVYHKDEARTK